MTEYTSSQTGALATLLAAAFWGIGGLGGGLALGEVLETGFAIYGILIVVAWILVALYWRQVRWAYPIGIITWVIGMIGLLTPLGLTGTPWYTFAEPLFNFSFVIFYLVGIAGIYFSYKSFLELKK